MSRRTQRRKRWGSGAQFLKLPHAYLESAQYASLSSRALKALIDLAAQHNGFNNGDLTATWSVMRKRGWTSKHQLEKSVKELIDRGWIILTRKGGRDRSIPSLYAVTWWGIDECGGKLDAGVKPNAVPLNLWKSPDSASLPSTKGHQRVKRLSRRTGSSTPAHGAKVLAFEPHRPVTRGENEAVS